MKTVHSSERGQALVLIVLAIVGLMGFSALAIDGGMLYAERRRAQNAADTAAFAAAMKGIDGGTEMEIENAGMVQAAINGFDDGDTNDVTVYHPPIGPYVPDEFHTKDYYLVVIRTDFSPYFAHFVYNGKLENTVWAVARAKASSNASPGNAIFATGPEKCHGVWFAGNADMTVTGGHVYSSSDKSDSEGCASGKRQGSAEITMRGGSIKTNGGFNCNRDGADNCIGINFDSGFDVEEDQPLEEPPHIDPPICTGYPSYPQEGALGSVTLQPGIYPDGIDLKNGDMVYLARGIYCLDGSLSMTGGVLNGEAGVVIYLRGSAAHPTGVDVTGGTIRLMAPTDDGQPIPVDQAGTPWSGLVIYQDEDNTGQLALRGNGESTYWGTVYAPGPTKFDGEDSTNKTAKCLVEGTGDSFNLRTQLICYSVHFSGNAEIKIEYDEKELHHNPSVAELFE